MSYLNRTQALFGLLIALLALPLFEDQTLHAASGENSWQTLPHELGQRVRQHLSQPWHIGEPPRAIVVMDAGEQTPLPFGMLSPEANPLATIPAMDLDFEKRRMLFFARALAIGINFSYFGDAFRQRDNGTTTNFGSAQSDVFLALCLSYWLTDAFMLNANLGWQQNRTVSRFAADERTINSFSLATLALGVGYYYSCFGPFGFLAELEFGGGFGGSVVRAIDPTFPDPFVTSSNAWSMFIASNIGLFFSMHRWMVFARMGALDYTLLSQAASGEFGGSGRSFNSSFNVGLNLKQIAIGMRFLLNYKGQQERYTES